MPVLSLISSMFTMLFYGSVDTVLLMRIGEVEQSGAANNIRDIRLIEVQRFVAAKKADV
jgi:hypothetical protein